MSAGFRVRFRGFRSLLWVDGFLHDSSSCHFSDIVDQGEVTHCDVTGNGQGRVKLRRTRLALKHARTQEFLIKII